MEISVKRMDNRTRRDLLSDLPLSIIHDILALVPIRDAIRTSLLSRQWRYTWTTLPQLLFDCTGVDLYSLMPEFEESTDKFISNVLALHKGPIHRFEISYPFYISVKSIEKWVLYLSRNDIRELIINMDWEGSGGLNLLKCSVYSCAKLTKLELSNIVLDPPPSTFKGFLCLTSLVLKGFVELSPNAVESLIPCCPVLERLTIDSLFSEPRISNPNLKNLQIYGEYAKLCLYAPLLAKLHVELFTYVFRHENPSSDGNYTTFFGGSTNLEELTGCEYFTEYLSIGIESCRPTLVFPRLKVIALEVNFGDIKELMVVARLIIGAPNLRKLEISARSDYESGDPHVSFRDFGFAPNFALGKLRVVSLPFVCDYRSGMQLIKFLLESSPVLKTMKLEFHYRNSFYDVAAALLGFRRASPNARIIIKSHGSTILC